MAKLDRNENIERESTRGDDWTGEEQWWRNNFAGRAYARADRGFEHYSPAYRYGFEEAKKRRGTQWTEVETDLERGWESARGTSKSKWEEMKDAVKDAWEHVTGGEHDRHRRAEGREVSPEVRF